jgi:iron complex outermembrane receptor protein
MKVGLRSVQVSLWIVASVLGSLTVAVGTLPVAAQEESERVDEWTSGRVNESLPSTDPPSHLPIHASTSEPATTVEEWIAQIEASLVQITDVRVEATEAGLQVILETENGALEVPETRAIGNALIADIPNATIAEDFSQADPIEGIALVSVTELPDNRVRVAITGTDAPPVAEVRSEAQGLVLAVTLGDADAVAEEDAIQVVVTGEQDEGYNPSRATTATRTDTPLRDIPASIQVIPRQVLEDRNVRDLDQAIETATGVNAVPSFFGAPSGGRLIRGFGGFSGGNFRDGFRDVGYFGVTPIGTIEQVEVFRGPASVLFGTLEPGGVINVVTRQPLNEPYYNLSFEAGSYSFYQPGIDLSGPLTEDDTVLYRFIASYQGSSDFQGFADNRLTTIAPSITFNFGEQTELDLYYEYTHLYANPPSGGTNAAILSNGSLSPRDVATYYPDLSLLDVRVDRFGYTLEHEFNDSWQIRNNVAVNLTRFREDIAGYPGVLEDDRFLGGFDASTNVYQRNNFFGQIDLLGEFETGSISHHVLAGFDFNRFSNDGDRNFADTPLPPIDIRSPNYDIPSPEFSIRSEFELVRRSYGVYLQDQIALLDNLKLLLGSRYDWISTDLETDFDTGGDVVVLPTRNDGAFSPRVGLVYQPSDTVALYASYTRSFFPVSGFDNLSPDADVTFDPTRGTQYEVGVKTDFLDGRLSATLAAYHLTRTNVLTPDPNNPTRSIQTGEQRSQGVELDVTGEILPGWNVILSYAYTDAEVTRDNTFPVGNRLPNVPRNQASLWTTYTIEEGTLEGLGFGLGLFYVGTRQGNLDNSFQLDDYFRTDAAVYYRRGRFRSAINVRNLFDIDAAAFAFSRTYVQRTEPFTIVGSISWEF